MSRWRIRKLKITWPSVLWVTVLWVLLWGDLSPGNVIAGLLIGILVPALLPLPAVPYHGRVRPAKILTLAGHFIRDLWTASFQVAFLALNPKHKPHSAVIGVQLRGSSDLYLATTAELSTLIPGSVVVEALRRNGMVYLHVLDLEAMGGPDQVRRTVLSVEERVLRALASDAELDQAGLEGAP
jgi:multicomponent Na+:H+ antiporter subunit E